MDRPTDWRTERSIDKAMHRAFPPKDNGDRLVFESSPPESRQCQGESMGTCRTIPKATRRKSPGCAPTAVPAVAPHFSLRQPS